MIEIEDEKELVVVEKDIQYLHEKIKPISISFRGYKEESLKASIIDTSNITNMSFSLAEMPNVTNLNLSDWDTSNVTTMRAMFYGNGNMTDLNLEGFDTSNVVDIAAMFQANRNLRNLNLGSFKTDKVTDMSDMFIFCQSLKVLNLSSWNTNKVTTMGRMFLEMNALEEIKGTLDMQNVVTTGSMLSYCQKLKEIRIKNLKNNIDLSTTSSLSVDSVNYLLMNVQDVSSSPKTITLGSNMSKASEEALANATSKGWIIN